MVIKVDILVAMLAEPRLTLNRVRDLANVIDAMESKADKLVAAHERKLVDEYSAPGASGLGFIAWHQLFHLLEQMTDDANHCAKMILSPARKEAWMSALTLSLLIALFAVLAAEFVNGWTDAPNAIATVISTEVVTPRQAILMAVVMNTVSAAAGTAVATTVGKGIVAPSALTIASITATMVSIVIWGGLAARFGIPVSKSHALLAGLAGAALAGCGFDAQQWTGWQKVGIGLLCSLLLGFGAAFALGRLITKLAGRASPTYARRNFDRAQMLSAGFMAFNHGLNDGQKFMGVFALTLWTGGVYKEFTIPWWVIILCALIMGAGTSAGGWKIIRTVGSKRARITSWQGFAATAAASSTISGASAYGIPLSTTHTITSAVVSVGASKRVSDVRWGVLRKILAAWCATFPACAAIAYIAATIANHIWG
jgi:PiT family inorganic phosphate transporter